MLVSVVIPVFNRADQLAEAVDSVLAQTFRDFELIVVDDGSEIDLSVIKERVLASGHVWLEQPNAGVAAARNRGVAVSKGEWVAFLDSDDRWLPQKLSEQLDYHEQHSDTSISQTFERWIRHGRRVNQRLKHAMPDGEGFSSSLKICCISPSSVMLRRELFDEHRGFNEEFPVCEDYDLWLRITAKERVGLVKIPLIEKFGGHPDQLS
ncbi:MAG: glycosyltransferase, partial [Bdellovibrionales bacterium]|nr:glycosyltransferase [Bdellovibrionales bacterium]